MNHEITQIALKNNWWFKKKPELVNLQDVKGKAKPYQIRQFLKLVEKYNLQLEDE